LLNATAYHFHGSSLQISSDVIPELDIWRAATLMLRRYGDKAIEESATPADQLDAEGDPDGAATWRWIARAIEQLANTTPPGPVH
jgi:hypothetical protein